ncbi:MAG: VOC family protein [Acidimicrobiales bacterium]
MNPFVISLPIADRARTAAFYQAVLESDPVGEPTEDGLPEPLQFAPVPDVRLMFVPSEGFAWVIGARRVAGPDTSECVIGLNAADDEEVDSLVHRAVDAGGAVVTEAAETPWGYSAAVADPDGHLVLVVVG